MLDYNQPDVIPPSQETTPTLNSTKESAVFLGPISEAAPPSTKPSVIRIDTQHLHPAQPYPPPLNKNSIFFSESTSASPAIATSTHVRNQSNSSLVLVHSSSDISLDSLGATSPADTSMLADTSGHSGLRWAGGFGSSLQTPSHELSSSSSIRSRRNWEEFEAKSVSPLPSPLAPQRLPSSPVFDFHSPANQTANSSHPKTHKPSIMNDVNTARSRPLTYGKPSLSLSLAKASDISTKSAVSEPSSGSKNLSFFGSSYVPLPPTNRLPKHTRTTSGSDASDGSQMGHWSNPSGSTRAVSADLANRLLHPSRLPTLPAEQGVAIGTSASSSIQTYLAASTRELSFPNHARISSGESMTSNERTLSSAASIGLTTSSDLFQNASNSHTSLSAISDVPSATYDGLPSSSSEWSRSTNTTLVDDEHTSSSLSIPAKSSKFEPGQRQELPNANDKETRGAASASYASNSGNVNSSDSLAPPSHPTSGRRFNSRHVLGPSESATGSSLLPTPVERNNGGQSTATAPPEEADDEEEESQDTIGPYKIEKILGVGAFSRVALGRLIRPANQKKVQTDKKIASLSELRKRALENSTPAETLKEQFVALKMLDREPCSQNERIQVSWIREVEVLKHISHPNLVRFVTSFNTPFHHTLVLEQVGGGELFDLLAKHHDKIAKREWLVRRIYSELANAVGWMHHINLVHRDIKLENILMTESLFANSEQLDPSQLPKNPILKLTDFGLSRFIDPNNPLLETRCGSEEYAAPELIIGKKYDGRRTDAWALGVVLFALVTGSLPFIENLNMTSAREGHTEERDAKQRKAHLLRIAKGDLRWPNPANDECVDEVVGDGAGSPPASLRLVTPMAKCIVGRLLRRDSTKRATPWETWDEPWLLCGSFGTDSLIPNEKSAKNQPVDIHPDPRSQAGQAWLDEHARVKTEDVSQVACDD